MPRKMEEGRRPLSLAERQARWRERKAEEVEAMRKALEQVVAARTAREKREAREMAIVALRGRAALDMRVPSAAEFRAMQERGEFPTDEALAHEYPGGI